MKDSRAETEEAWLVLSLSCAPDAMKAPRRRSRRTAAGDGVFECRTCYKQFRSFQALGGHCTSHKRAAAAGGGGERARGWKLRPVLHKCGVCGLEFSLGQALGGHMRRHGKSAASSATSTSTLSGDSSTRGSVVNSDATVDRSEDGLHGVLLQLFA